MFEQTCQVTERLTFGKVGDSEHVLEVSFLNSKIKQVTEKESQEREQSKKASKELTSIPNFFLSNEKRGPFVWGSGP